MNLVVFFKDLFKVKIIDGKLLWIKVMKVILIFVIFIFEVGSCFRIGFS